MYVSLKPTKSACFGGCQIPHEKRSVFDHQFNFLKFVRGGTSGSLARRQTCMYVCMFELQTYPKHVCMYVCLRLLSMYVCMSLSNLQNLLVSEGVKFLTKNVQYLITNPIFGDL